MPILVRYLLAQLCFVLILVWAGLVGFVALFDLLASISAIKADYDTLAAFHYVLMLLPRRFYDLLPVASLLATLIVMGNLANQSELIIMQASGKSKITLVTYLAIPLVFLSFISMAIFDNFILDLQKNAIAERESKLGNPRLDFSKPYWYKDKDRIIHFKYPISAGFSKHIHVYQFDFKNFAFSRYIYAASIYFDQQHNQWLLQDTKDYRFTEDKLTYQQEPTLPLDLAITPYSLWLATTLPDFLKLTDLYNYIHHFERDTQTSYAYELAFWSRLFVPLSTFALICLGAAFIFGPLRNTSVSQRIMTGFFIGLIFSSLQGVFGAISIVFAIHPIILIILPSLLVLLLAFFLQQRIG